MAYDTQSTELATLDDFPGQKIAGRDSAGKPRKFKFSAVAMSAAGKTGQMTTALPANSTITAIFVEADSGTGTISVGLSTGAATDVLPALTAPASADVFAGKNVSAGGAIVYATSATAAISISGWVEYVPSA